MPRPPKLRNPRAIVAHVEAEVKEEMDKARGKLSWGEFFTLMWKREKDYITLLAENENLRRENEELKARINELLSLVDRLQKALEKSKALPKEDKELLELKEKVGKIFSTATSMKMLDFLKKLGYKGSADQLKAKVRDLLDEYFVQEGYYFVSYELGLKVVPKHGFGELAWTVTRISSPSSKPEPKQMEVLVDGS